jgi:hypothetical protein
MVSLPNHVMSTRLFDPELDEGSREGASSSSAPFLLEFTIMVQQAHHDFVLR